jgi:glucose-1-phosphate thymidylyltransferase
LGVVVFDEDGNPQELIEKPTIFRSKWAIPGLYFYDSSAPERARKLKPSKRNELEITDLNLGYLNSQKLTVHKLPRGTAWLDLGTEDGLLEAGQFVKLIQDRQGQLIGSPEEIAFICGWVEPEQILKNLDNKKSNYAVKLKSRILGNN